MKRIIALWLAVLMLAAQPIQAAVCVGFGQSPSGPACTGSSSFIRGGSSTGSNEAFEYGTDDYCNSDWTPSGTTGINPYSTAQYQSGTHSLALTDDSGTTGGRFYADHGSAQTSQYYRFYLYSPSLSSGAAFYLAGVGKYNTTYNGAVRVFYASASTNVIGTASFTSETITINTGEWYRVEFSVSDSDGSGAGYTSYIVKVYNSSGTAVATSNGGSDYEIGYTTSTDQFRYFHVFPAYSNATAVTVYIDNLKNCDTWCGAE